MRASKGIVIYTHGVRQPANITEGETITSNTPPLGKRLLSQQAVLDRVPVSRTTLWRMERAGQFPKRIQISPNRVAWLEADIDAWLEGRKSVHSGHS